MTNNELMAEILKSHAGDYMRFSCMRKIEGDQHGAVYWEHRAAEAIDHARALEDGK